MGRAGLIRKAGSPSEGGVTQSYEDREGLFINLGVISALIMSLIVGFAVTIPVEELDAADRLFLVFRSEVFRDHVDPDMAIRTELGIPDNFTDGIGVSEPMEFSLTTYRKEFGLLKPYERGLRQLAHRVDILQMRIWLDSLQDHLDSPSQMLRIGGSASSKTHTIESCAISYPIYENSLWAFGTCMISLLLSIFAYISMNVSDAREKPEILILWWKVGGRVMAVGGYLSLMFSLGFLFMALNWVTWMRMPHLQLWSYTVAFTWYVMAVPMILITVLVLMNHAWCYYSSNWGAHRDDKCDVVDTAAGIGDDDAEEPQMLISHNDPPGKNYLRRFHLHMRTCWHE